VAVEVLQVNIERALESRPRRATLDIGCETLVRGDHVRVIEGPQHGRHDQTAGREPIAIEVGLLAQRVGELGRAPADELQRAGPAQLGPFLVGVE
jgi:hypothetical protein